MIESRGHKQEAKVFKALGHPSRLAMVEALSRGEMCVRELTDLVGAGVSTVSKHLAVLREAGVVEDEKQGMQVYYRLRMACVTGFLARVRQALEGGDGEDAATKGRKARSPKAKGKGGGA